MDAFESPISMLLRHEGNWTTPSFKILLTALRPDTLRHWVNGTHFRDRSPDILTLPQHFKAQEFPRETPPAKR